MLPEGKMRSIDKILLSVMFVLIAQAHTVLAQNDLQRLVRKVRSSVVTVVAFNGDGKQISQGTGFFVSNNGALITNYHVLAGAKRASIKTRSGSVYDIIETLTEDADNDLIAVRANIPTSAIHPLQISSAPVAPGQRIVVVGSPLGLAETISEGIISAIRQVPDIGRIIQITAPVSPGSSGSPVVNIQGQIIGVASFNLKGGQNINFAIPSERVTALIARSPKPLKPTATAQPRNRRARPTSNSQAKSKSKNEDAKFDSLFAEILEDERKSIPTLEERIAKNPRDIEAHENLGRAYSNLYGVSSPQACCARLDE
jgi:S1-C subfamily serine protease